MAIERVIIKNFKKFKDPFEIRFNENINLLVGDNESGKSTLLNFIVNSFYGISKNKKGKEYSDVEKYTPWLGEEFSGKLEYELNNKNKYEIYRDFKKKNPKIFNENMEDILDTAQLLQKIEGEEEVEKMDALLSLAITGGDCNWI